MHYLQWGFRIGYYGITKQCYGKENRDMIINCGFPGKYYVTGCNKKVLIFFEMKNSRHKSKTQSSSASTLQNEPNKACLAKPSNQ